MINCLFFSYVITVDLLLSYYLLSYAYYHGLFALEKYKNIEVHKDNKVYGSPGKHLLRHEGAAILKIIMVYIMFTIPLLAIDRDLLLSYSVADES